ncbi:MAG: hypothetical protein AB7K04_03395 [Pseudorhodoplanes sp.]
MISLILTCFLWAVVAVLAVVAARQGQFQDGAKAGILEFFIVAPRIGIGMIGSGFIAEIMPQQFINDWLGPGSGPLGILIVIVLGALTPGGPVIGFAVAVGALKGGAGMPQVVAYTTAWALYALPRLLAFEFPMMPVNVVWIRVLVSLPIPFLMAGLAALIGKP